MAINPDIGVIFYVQRVSEFAEEPIMPFGCVSIPELFPYFFAERKLGVSLFVCNGPMKRISTCQGVGVPLKTRLNESNADKDRRKQGVLWRRGLRRKTLNAPLRRRRGRPRNRITVVNIVQALR